METLREGLGQGLRTLTETLQEARDAAADVKLPDGVGTSLQALAADVPKLPDVSTLAADFHAPDLHLRDATRRLRTDGFRVPDVAMPDVRLDASGLRALGRRAGSARDFVGSLPEYRVRRETRSPATGAILGAVLVGMIGGVWLATWPVTAPRVRAFLETLRSRLGLNDGWSAASARDALHRIDTRSGGWRDGPLSRRRRRNAMAPADPDRGGGIAGVAVGPGHLDGAGIGAPTSDELPVGSASSLIGSPGSAGGPADDRDIERGAYGDAGHPGTPDHGSEPG